MILAVAALLFHPQIAPQSFSAEKVQSIQTASSAFGTDAEENDVMLPLAPVMAENTNADMAGPAAEEPSHADSPTPPVVESRMTTLPDAPDPAMAEPAPAPAALIVSTPSKAMTVSVDELRAETTRNDRIWMGLGIAAHSGATFDAWTTRHAITTAGAQELDPLLKPFAGNASLYLAIQAGPALMDYAAKKMMYNKRSWVRKFWWAPQAASFVTSIVCGAHNLAVE